MGSRDVLNHVHVNEILEHAPDGMFTIDTGLIIQYVNPAFCNLLDFSRDELLGTPITDYLGDLNILNTCMANVETDGHCNDQETIFKKRDGSVIHISKSVQALYNQDGSIQNILVSIRDLTHLHTLNKELSESKEILEQYTNNLEALVQERTDELTMRLLYDTQTGLPNRAKLFSDLESLTTPHTVVLFNIDSFKEINTYYGHVIGDALLSIVAEELVLFANTLEQASVYKLPVDEYALLIEGGYARTDIEMIVSELSDHIANKTFVVLDHEISLSATMGIAASYLATDENYNLLSRTDMALKLAKKTRKDYVFYNTELHIKEDYEKNLSWIKRLRSAIEEDRIVPFYQPIVNASTLKIEKYEALVRIIESDGTIITPYHFLDISKKIKLYHHITSIMITKVFEELRSCPDIVCSINLSIEDIVNPQINSFIINKIRSSPVSSRVIFEILESEGIENYETVNEFITEVKKYGVKIALDDFGAGYSNFAYIVKLNVDYIKIDGSIIRNIDENLTSKIITKTILDFAFKLNIKTVAEFVSDEKIFNYLQTLPIDYMQGYYFAEPQRSIR